MALFGAAAGLLFVGALLAVSSVAYLRLRLSRRTIGELQAQLIQAQKLESLGLLAGAVAHDFNNLLSAIRGYSELLTRETSGRSAEHAREVLKAADGAASLTRQLLTFSHRDRQDTEPIDVSALVADTSSMFGRLVGPAIEFECAVEPVAAEADGGRLQQLLLNLVVNARDAMPDGGRLRIETRPVEVGAQTARRHVGAHAGPYALISVQDTGAGIDGGVRERMFEPFFTTKPPGVGTGLGLSTVYGIVRQHNGFIAVDTAPGEGTRFCIYIPATDRAPVTPPLPEAKALSAGGSVVVVEVDPLVRDLVREMLAQTGHDVFATADPEAALRHVSEDGCDLIVTDLTLPKITGLQLVERARSVQPGLRALFMSGLVADPESFTRTSGEYVVAKPFTIEEFLSKVGEALTA
ncbi:MAG TPA: ATP-binding protein [Gaiellaceae bacterium]|nr:ATP-binding protein [Gaiellaceae bacterium]